MTARFGEERSRGVHEVVGVVADTRYDVRACCTNGVHPIALHKKRQIAHTIDRVVAILGA